MRHRSRNSSLAAPRPPARPPRPRAADEGRRTVAAVTLLGRPGQAGAQVGDDGHGRAPGAARTPTCAGQRQQQGGGGGARRPREVVRPAGSPEAERRVHRRGARLVEIRRVRGGQDQVLHGCLSGTHGEGTPPRLHAQRRRVLVVRGHRTGPHTAAAAEDARDGGALQPPVGKVGPPRRDPCAHGPILGTAAPAPATGPAPGMRRPTAESLTGRLPGRPLPGGRRPDPIQALPADLTAPPVHCGGF